MAIGPRTDRKLCLHSENFSESREFDLDEAEPRRMHHWSDYVRGVALTLQQHGHRLAGANLLISGEIPLGAGLSSSAALEVATALALAQNSGVKLDPLELTLLCQKAESEFVGMRCGIMDQFVSCFGRAQHALLLDCRSLEYELVPLPPQVRLVVCDTQVKHELAGGAYNERRQDCETGVGILSRFLPQLRALRDVTLESLEQHRAELPETVYRRCLHVVAENGRVLRARESLARGDLEEFKQLMAQSHQSLKNNYEVSCKELDLLVDLAGQMEGVWGARLTGAGFGGSTINLVATPQLETFRACVSEGYRKATGLRARIYVCEAAEGAGSYL